jgi:type I restriction enzyme S subunit
MLVPDFQLLKIHNAAAHDLFRKRQSNLDNIDVLINLRDTLLPKLISGELRVPEAEEAVEAAV